VARRATRVNTMSRKDDTVSVVYSDAMASGPTARRRPAQSRGDIREQRLIAEAEILLRDRRFDEASISEIAAAAEISRPTFYFYFASKQALLDRLIESTLDELVARHRTRVQGTHDSPADELRGLLHDVAAMWVEHGVVLGAAADLAGTVPALFDRIAGVMEAVLDDRVAFVMAAGTTPEVATRADARATTEALFWMSERNFYVLFRSDPTEAEYHELAERLFRIWARVAGIAVD
jgi:TetR/AcrR family transcriptional regulator, ethionamide resistance regulator